MVLGEWIGLSLVWSLERALYSVMQSDGYNFFGDVVLDSFNKASWDEDNFEDQIYKSKYVRIIIKMILILYNIMRKYIVLLTLQ